MLDLTRPLTSALGMLLAMMAHHVGWPLIEGGSQKLADAMVTALEQQGGEVVTGHEVTDLREFAGVPAVLLDTTPEAFVAMAGDRLHEGYRRWVRRYHHGPGVFKIDWVLSEPVPWANADVRRAGTIHVAGTLEETIAGEARRPGPARRPALRARRPADRADPTRAPDGRPHLLGLRARAARLGRRHDRGHRGAGRAVRARASATPSSAGHEERRRRWSSGTRATWAGTSPTARRRCGRCSPARCRGGTPTRRRCRGIYLASAATPPGPAVHGTCGDNAARVALREVFGVREAPPLRPAVR